jgi:thiamine biosynthesis protein ThiI
VPPTVLVRYGELALKSPPVRREFERTLGRNILEQFERAGVSCRLRSDRGHLYLDVDDAELGARLVGRVFGVTSVSAVREAGADRAAIETAVLELAGPALVPGASFAVRARRTGQHAFTSQELARDLGGAVLAKWPERALRVDLGSPEVEIAVEVRDKKAYVSLDRRPGPGGLPLGVAGRVVALVDGPRGALGAYLMMKRGCRCAVVTTPAGERYAREVLTRFDPRAELTPAAEPPEGTVAGIAESTRADGIVLPLPVEAFPSEHARWGDRVIFSPTVGLTDEEVAARWRTVEELVA